jgi:hypothetical protein
VPTQSKNGRHGPHVVVHKTKVRDGLATVALQVMRGRVLLSEAMVSGSRRPARSSVRAKSFRCLPQRSKQRLCRENAPRKR